MRSAPEAPGPEPVRGWLVSPAFDAAFVLGPTWLAGLGALAIPEGTPLPAWGWVFLVLGIDVAHVWGTLYRTYLDPEELRRRPLLYAGAPLVALAGCLSLQALAPGWFWTALAYLAAFHFVRQAVGIGALYRARSGRPTRDRAGRRERAALYAVTGVPLWWWHTALPLPFDWFAPGDFLGPLPRITLIPVGLAGAAAVGLHLSERIRERRAAPGSDLWLLGTALAWFAGIVISRSDAAFTLSNVVAHGAPYLALIWWTSRRRWIRSDRGAVHRAWFEPPAAPLALGALVALAFLEEALWDGLVWHERPELFGDWEGMGWTSRWVALLAVPQVTHYLLDGFVWRLGPENPELGGLLGLDGRLDRRAARR